MNRLFVALLVAWTVCGALSLSARGDDDQAAAPKPPATKPAPPEVDAAARKLLDDVRDAYAKLYSLELTGTISFASDVAGEKRSESGGFSAAFQAPNKYRHEMRGDVVLGSTGERCYVFQPATKAYVLKDAPKDRVALGELPRTLSSIVQMQNPSLALAIAKDAADELLDGSTEIKKLPDTDVGGKSCQVLFVRNSDASEFTFLFDAHTHLLRQARLDQRKLLEAGGQRDVKQALLTYEYPSTTACGDEAAAAVAAALAPAEAKPDRFAWTPPDDGRDLSNVVAPRADEGVPGALDALVGKAAPDFKLPGLDGKEHALSDLKESVVVVDFWATWCGPCVQSLPHLNKLYEEFKDRGLRVLAVSVDEDKSKVPPFVNERKLTFTVLLDNEQAKASEKFGVQGIPHTVVIGRDGRVRKVLVGFGPGSEERLRAEIEAALKAGR